MFDLKQEAETITRVNQRFDEFIARHRNELLSGLKDDQQRVTVRYYLKVLQELCTQGCGCLQVQAYSTLEALSRVIMEQSANMFYVGMDGGDNVRALLRSSKTLTESNGKSWVAYLAEKGIEHPAAQARLDNGALMREEFDKRWPNVARYPGGKGLFTAIGWENAYYAFYSPLCDSVHSFSDDLSNLVMTSEVIAESKEYGEKVQRYIENERRRLATYHYAMAIGLRAEAFGGVWNALELSLDQKEVDDVFGELSSLIQRHENFDSSRLSELNAGDTVLKEFVVKQ